jgi:hypothetical protein
MYSITIFTTLHYQFSGILRGQYLQTLLQIYQVRRMFFSLVAKKKKKTLKREAVRRRINVLSPLFILHTQHMLHDDGVIGEFGS